jgi:membrane protein
MSTVKRFVIGMYNAISNDDITDVAAMMAYYAAFALFPMLVFIVTLTLLILPADVLHQGVAMVTPALPRALGDLIAQQIDRMAQAASSGFAIGGAALAVWGASRGAASLGGALNRMFQKKETRPWWKRQLLAIAVTLFVALLIVVALTLLLIGPTAGHYVADRFELGGAFDQLWLVVRWVGAGLIVMLVWALLYKLMPDTDAPFRVFTPGAIVGVVLWLGISYLFGLYLSYHDTYEATYGTLGGAIVFLTWLWISNLALLVGAEINDVVADLRAHKDDAAAELARHELPPQVDPAHADDRIDEELPLHLMQKTPPAEGSGARRPQ